MKNALTIPELCQEIGIGRSKVYELMKSGDLTGRKIGKRTVFLAKDVEDYLNALPLAS